MLSRLSRLFICSPTRRHTFRQTGRGWHKYLFSTEGELGTRVCVCQRFQCWGVNEHVCLPAYTCGHACK